MKKKKTNNTSAAQFLFHTSAYALLATTGLAQSSSKPPSTPGSPNLNIRTSEDLPSAPEPQNVPSAPAQSAAPAEPPTPQKVVEGITFKKHPFFLDAVFLGPSHHFYPADYSPLVSNGKLVNGGKINNQNEGFGLIVGGQKVREGAFIFETSYGQLGFGAIVEVGQTFRLPDGISVRGAVDFGVAHAYTHDENLLTPAIAFGKGTVLFKSPKAVREFAARHGFEDSSTGFNFIVEPGSAKGPTALNFGLAWEGRFAKPKNSYLHLKSGKHAKRPKGSDKDKEFRKLDR